MYIYNRIERRGGASILDVIYEVKLKHDRNAYLNVIPAPISDCFVRLLRHL